MPVGRLAKGDCLQEYKNVGEAVLGPQLSVTSTPFSTALWALLRALYPGGIIVVGVKQSLKMGPHLYRVGEGGA